MRGRGIIYQRKTRDHADQERERPGHGQSRAEPAVSCRVYWRQSSGEDEAVRCDRGRWQPATEPEVLFGLRLPTVSMESPRITLAAAKGVNARGEVLPRIGRVARRAATGGPTEKAAEDEAAAQQVGEDEGAVDCRTGRWLPDGGEPPGARWFSRAKYSRSTSLSAPAWHRGTRG